MIVGDGESPQSAGVSSPDDVDVQALFECLQEEVRRAPLTANRTGATSDRVALRVAAERAWPVTAERPLQRRPGILGALAQPVKRILRKLMRWYVEPLAADQRAFNDAVLKLLDDFGERLDALHALTAGLAPRVDELTDAQLVERVQSAERTLSTDGRLLHELEERLLRLERRSPAAAAAVPDVQPAAAPSLDYFAFESRMRGPVDLIRERQRVYVDDFRAAEPVLDIGCGRGEFLALLREARVDARGIDADADMVAYCRGEGLDVEQAEALSYLAALEDGTLGGIFAAHVVEHFPPPALLRLLELAAAKLRPGGLLAAETVNPLALAALRYYFSDLSHAQPLVPQTLAFLARQAGFQAVEIRYLNEPPPEERMRDVELPPRAEFDAARQALADNVRLLNEHVFGPLDYAVLARR